MTDQPKDQPNAPRKQLFPEGGEMKLVPFPESDSHPPSDYSKLTRTMVNAAFERIRALEYESCESKTRTEVISENAANLITKLRRICWAIGFVSAIALLVAVVALIVALDAVR